jgi:hypothetical protein
MSPVGRTAPVAGTRVLVQVLSKWSHLVQAGAQCCVRSVASTWTTWSKAFFRLLAAFSSQSFPSPRRNAPLLHSTLQNALSAQIDNTNLPITNTLGTLHVIWDVHKNSLTYFLICLQALFLWLLIANMLHIVLTCIVATGPQTGPSCGVSEHQSLEDPSIFYSFVHLRFFKDPRYCSLVLFKCTQKAELLEGFRPCNEGTVRWLGCLWMNVLTVQ